MGKFSSKCWAPVFAVVLATLAAPRLMATPAEHIYIYCFARPADVYYSEVFAPSSAEDIAAAKTAFAAYVKQRYGIDVPAAHCPVFTNQALARQARDGNRTDYERSHAHTQPPGKVFDTGWTFAATAAARPSPRAAAPPPAAAERVPAGSPGYTSCHAQSGGTNYMSGIFTATDATLSKISMDYRAFIAHKYDLDPRRFSYACDNVITPTAAQASDRKIADIKRMERDPTSHQTIETQWTPETPLPPVSAPVIAADDPHDPRLSQLDPEAQRIVLAQAQAARGYCQTNPTLGSVYDCSCFAQQIASATIDGLRYSLGPGGRRRISITPYTNLISTVPLRTCVSTPAVSKYVQSSMKTHPPNTPSVEACTTQAMEASLRQRDHTPSDTSVLIGIFGDALRSCR